MVICKQTQTNVVDTKYEYDGEGNLIHKVVTETSEIPEPVPQATVTCSCSCDDFDEDAEVCYEHELEIPINPLDIITGVAGVASIIASGCLIFKALKK